MGVGTLLEAKQIVLLVTGEAKADMLRRTLEESDERGRTSFLATHCRTPPDRHCR